MTILEIICAVLDAISETLYEHELISSITIGMLVIGSVILACTYDIVAAILIALVALAVIGCIVATLTLVIYKSCKKIKYNTKYWRR